MTRQDLARFKRAQEPVFASALAELRSGRKLSHWIWFVLPQLAGLGRSLTARDFGLEGVDEARAYLDDALLSSRLLEATLAVCEQLEHPGTRLGTLMGSRLDALKLISSLTLFERVASERSERDPQSARLADACAAALDAADAQGLPRCSFTLQRL